MQLMVPLADGRGITMSLARDGEASDLDEIFDHEVMVYADRTRLKQVFLNLLSNAVKYNREDGRITLAFENPREDVIRISVSDSGPGMTQEQQNDLFKAFNRLGAEQSDIEGTGIGLVITKRIVELMKGCIGVESQVGEGTTFWVEFPCSIKTSDNEAADVAQEIFAAAGDEVINGVGRKSILYIEDNPANLRLVEQLIAEMPNIDMWSAADPVRGLEIAEQHAPDLILLDINLPGMNGYKVLEELRGKTSSSHLPIIAVSANAMPDDIEKGLQAGFNDYITKPIEVNRLLDVVGKSLRL
jgi:CheY-like chemotaxis protein/anti-sigma regulatory factor (Ser/Thr protein kinase)